MRKWDERPVESAYNLNPAFHSEVIRRCLYGYESKAEEPFHLSLLYLTLPIILHKDTREKFSHRTRKPLHAWLREYPQVRVDFADRLRNFAPYCTEALAFLAALDEVSIENESVRLKAYSSPPSLGGRKDEVAECYRQAAKLGRWLAEAGDPAQVYTMWGVRP